MKIVYIVGDGRSGSTLLETVLSNVEDSVSIGEAYRFWIRFYQSDTLCGCNEKIEQCKLWSFVNKTLYSKVANYNPKDVWNKIQFLLLYKNTKKIPEIINTPEWEDIKTIIKLFYTSISEKTQSKVIIDSSKSVGWLFILLALDFCEIKIIHLERNLEEVANSWKKNIYLPEYYNKKVEMPKKSNFIIIKNWLKIGYLVSKLKKQDNYLYINYNLLIKNPDKYILKIEDFTNLKINKPYKKKYNHGIGGNPLRRNNNKFITIRNTSPSLENLTIIETIFFKSVNFLKKKFI